MTVYNCKIELLSKTEIAYCDFRQRRRCEDIKPIDPFTKELLNRFDHWIRNEKPRPMMTEREDFELLGLCLYDLLLPPDSEARADFESDYDFVTNIPGNRLRVTLVFHDEAKEMANYPWEFLLMPARKSTPEKRSRDRFFLAGQKVQLILTRFVPDVEHQLGQIEKQLRILLVYSNPEDKELADLNTDETLEAITTIQNLEKSGSVKVKLLKNPTYAQIDDAIKKPGKDGEEAFRPHIVHFIGHGDAKEGLALQMTDEECKERAMERSPKKAAWKDSSSICDLFSEDPPPRLVFLHACEGAKADTLESFSSLARDLVLAKVPAVVAMQYAIKTKDAALFASVFYRELSKGKDVDEAVSEGRTALGMPTLGSQASWCDRRFGTPVVYLQSEKAIVEIPPRKEDDFDPTVKVPCPNPQCEGKNTLDTTECVLCDHVVAICPKCKDQGIYRLMDKTIGKCGICRYQISERQVGGISSRATSEKAQASQAAPVSSAADAPQSSPSTPTWTDAGSNVGVIIPEIGSSN